MRRVSMATRYELVAAVLERYGRSERVEKTRILDEFAAVTASIASTPCACFAPDERRIARVCARIGACTTRRCARR